MYKWIKIYSDVVQYIPSLVLEPGLLVALSSWYSGLLLGETDFVRSGETEEGESMDSCRGSDRAFFRCNSVFFGDSKLRFASGFSAGLISFCFFAESMDDLRSFVGVCCCPDIKVTESLLNRAFDIPSILLGEAENEFLRILVSDLGDLMIGDSCRVFGIEFDDILTSFADDDDDLSLRGGIRSFSTSKLFTSSNVKCSAIATNILSVKRKLSYYMNKIINI